MFAFGDKVWPGIAKVTEEFGEALQVIGRIVMMGGKTVHWSGADLRNDLIEELADAKASIEFIEMKVFTEAERTRFNLRKESKVHQFLTWHREQAVPEETKAASPVMPCPVAVEQAYRPAAQQEHSAVLHAAGIPSDGCGGEHSDIMRAIGHG
ncbi:MULTISPECIES: hypothetical protein [unclassified Sphingopyxis]|uniref:hypothetical protein n=1 Tax=unclassified Sphingopyxis TaxID=2614943 RepID=UPI00285EE365|nr:MULTISPECIES: hypothetical protein [unclassified Sphingopyxis]MDR7061986.1 hypothetical protein [Sphingopyxis sp. BE235]MDR7182445.1 hypothetical protein [Sphingopyxis sp. BE249]